MSEKIYQLKKILEHQPENYLQAKEQSQQIDQLLGFRCDEVEKTIPSTNDGKINWSHLHVQAHQTPYSEFLEICRHLKPQPRQTFIDIGAGYCRLGIILRAYYPEVFFWGFELSAERIQEAIRVFQELELNRDNLLVQDVADSKFVLPDFDFAFIYDFGSPQDIQKLLSKLQIIARNKSIFVIARGKGIRHQILSENLWLAQINEPYHTEHWSVFRS